MALACTSAILFGGTSVAIRLALRRSADAELGAFWSALVGFVLCAAAVAISRDQIALDDALPFLLAGLVAPGVSQVLFFRAVRDAGAARTSVVVGAAPLVSVAIALVALDEPVRAPLLAGAVLIVGGGIALASERERPIDFRNIGIAAAIGCTILFASRDNVIRWLAGDTDAKPLVAAAATFLGGSIVMGAYSAYRHRNRLAPALGRAALAYLPASTFFGLSYMALFEAYYRGRVTVVSPLVATESLWGVLLAALVLGRTELVGRRLAAGAGLVVAGGALIGAFR